jgi:hypothetical protein
MEIKNVNMEQRHQTAHELERIASQIEDLIEEARGLTKDHPAYSNWDAYVFSQLAEHVECANPYNQSLNSIAEGLRDPEEDGEPCEAWGEEWNDEEEDA